MTAYHAVALQTRCIAVNGAQSRDEARALMARSLERIRDQVLAAVGWVSRKCGRDFSQPASLSCDLVVRCDVIRFSSVGCNHCAGAAIQGGYAFSAEFSLKFGVIAFLGGEVIKTPSTCAYAMN